MEPASKTDQKRRPYPSFADIFSRPMEESSDEEEEVPAAAALETDLEKYLKLPELPLTMADGKGPCSIPGQWPGTAVPVPPA